MGKDIKGKELGKNISQRKDGTYEARYYDRFGKRRSLYNKNLKDLRDELNTALYEDKNELNIVDEKITLDEWYDKWLNTYKYDVIGPNTRRHYISIYKKHISPALGMLPVSGITQFQIRALIRDLDKKGYQYETKSKVKILLVDMFDKAIANDLMRKNVARGIKVVRNESIERKVLTNEEQEEFFNCARGTFYYNLFVVAAETGLRPGEACALTVKDLDFAKKRIQVNKTIVYQKYEGDVQKEFHIGPTKTKSSVREVPMTACCEAALQRQLLIKQAVMGKTPKSIPGEFRDLLFVTKYGTPINAVVYNAAIDRIIDEINLQRMPLEEMEHFSAHSFRHTFATRCFEAGMSPKTVQMLLGHASIKMTMDLYTHLQEGHKEAEMKKLEANALHTEAIDGQDTLAQLNSDENSNIINVFGVKLA